MKTPLYILFLLVTLFLFVSFTLPGLADGKPVATSSHEADSRATPKSL